MFFIEIRLEVTLATQPFSNSGIACSSNAFNVFSGYTGYSTTVTYINGQPLTFTGQINVDMQKCEIKGPCQTIAKLRVRVYCDNFTNTNITCKNFLSQTYDTNLMQITCQNKRC